MVAYRSLKNPPIKEAVIELRFPGKITPEQIVKFVADQKIAHESKQELVQFNANFQFAKGLEPVQAQVVPVAPIGARLKLPEDLTVFIQADRCSVNITSVPYPGWEMYWGRASKLFAILLSLYGHSVKRMGLRYINIIDLPLELQDFNEYFNLFTHVPPEPDFRGLSQLFMQMTISSQNPAIFANVTQAFAQADFQRKVLPYTFDIDTICVEPFEAKGNAILETLEAMRTFRNSVFFGNLTEKCMELFR